MSSLPARDRLIVALDVPTADEAFRTIDDLDNVNFFKVGWQLFMTGEMLRLLDRLRGKQVFVDLKVPADIGNTIASVVEVCARYNVQFLTLSKSVPARSIEAAAKARGPQKLPKLLSVPFLSNLDERDLRPEQQKESLKEYILTRGGMAIRAGCDGLIASGPAIGWCRRKFGSSIVIVSPGVRPAGSSTDDHKRLTTPEEAIRLGADYLVVGRPILKDPKPRDAADRIIAEIDRALGVGTM